jgi:hypothetical protein
MEKTYCGTKQLLPDTYTRFGTSYECLRKGVGVGKNLKIKTPFSIILCMIITCIFTTLNIILLIIIIILQKIDSKSSKELEK